MRAAFTFQQHRADEQIRKAQDGFGRPIISARVEDRMVDSRKQRGGMWSMWTVDETSFSLLRGGGGQPFTAFLDALIRTHGFVHGIGESKILTSLRTNIADGGIDTQVRCAIASETTGFLLQPTCWQYKAKDYADVRDDDLRKEIDKPYAKQLIGEGYAYRFAICDDMPAEKQTAWERLLTDCARQINERAPAALIVTASQLASWANRYPALLPAHFGYDSGPVVFFDAWSRSITKVTPTFVPLADWDGPAALIQQHVNFINPVLRATLPLQGLAGVGKTRLVHHIIAKTDAAQHLLLYTNDGDDAENVARSLANDRKTRCILVADECPVASRVKIGNILRGHTDRVRVVCIDNSGERPIGGEEELRLDELKPSSVEEVLAKNFPRLPADRRRAYADLSGGYIRFAADMCERDAEIEAKGQFGPAIAMAQEYYLNRFPEDEKRRALEAIALVQKVGFGEGVSEELDALCLLTDQKPQRVLEIAGTLKDAPGFIARTTRYLYITPEIIARVAFECAWRRWIEVDPEGFLRRIPAILLESFQARVARSSSSEVRARTGQFFWNSVADLKPADIGDKEVAAKLATLVETNPDQYFPQLARLVRDATLEELRDSRGGLGQDGSRRTLVWTAESLAAFPKYFAQAEEILRRLALAETEAQIGNNATGVWKELFRIQLSGASTPFADRIDLLGRLIFSSDDAEKALALEGLKETLNLTGTRLVGRSVVAGQIVPSDWRPRTLNEFQECLTLILSLFDRAFEHGTSDMPQILWPTLARHLRYLLANDMLPSLKTLINRHPIPDAYLPDMLVSIEDFLQYECGSESGNLLATPECQAAADWLRSIMPSNFEARLKAIVGKDSWHHSMREDISHIPSEIVPLAEELNRDAQKLEMVLPYLNSRAAASAGLLGKALGELDKDARHMNRVLGTASESGSTAFACGYVYSLATDPDIAERLNKWLDRLETESPRLAHFLSIAAPQTSSPYQRAVRMIGARKLPVQSLESFIPGIFLSKMTSHELTTIFDMLVEAGDAESLHIAVDFIGHCVQFGRRLDSKERESMWLVLERSASIEDRADYWWVRAIEIFAPDAPERACSVALLALTGDDHEKRNRAWDILCSLARTVQTGTQADSIMEAVGGLLLDKENGWRLQMVARSGLFQTLPLDAVQRWLDANGVDGAKVIANHLAPPSVSPEGKTELHPLTEYVLSKWGDEKSVFNRFVASTHNLQMYSGDIAASHKREADRARLFLSHSIPAIRKWAEIEVQLGEKQARDWTIQMEEQGL